MKKYIFLFNIVFFLYVPQKQFLYANEVNQRKLKLGIGFEHLHTQAKLKEIYNPLGMNYYGDRFHLKKKLQISPSIELNTTIANKYYIGILSSYNCSNSKTESRTYAKDVTYFIHKFKLRSYTDIFIKPGYKINSNTLLYGLGGISIAKWSHTTNQMKNNNQVTNDELKDKFLLSDRSLGIGIGAGLEYFLNEKFSLSINYTYYTHKTKSKKQNMRFINKINGWPTPRDGEVLKRIKPSYSTIGLRLTFALM